MLGFRGLTLVVRATVECDASHSDVETPLGVRCSTYADHVSPPSGSTIFVVLGAGASRACMSVTAHARAKRDLHGEVRESFLPPLVTDLFDFRWSHLLAQYPMVQTAAPEIRAATADSVALEEFLRTTYRDSADTDDKRTFVAIPLYLQHLLLDVTNNYTNHADNYALLTTILLRHFERVVYVTMNYDFLLETTLSARHPILSMEDFVSAPRWSVIKPHGSVTWSREISVNNPNYGDLPLDFDYLSGIEHHPVLDVRLQRVRNAPHARHFYPALAVPLGPNEKELLLPDSHQAHLHQKILEADSIDLLCIGYSANDPELLTLFARCERPVSSALVANHDEAASITALANLGAALNFAHDNAHNIFLDHDLDQTVGGPTGFEGLLSSPRTRKWLTAVAERRYRDLGWVF